jgi:ATP-dependent DNA helicase RecG
MSIETKEITNDQRDQILSRAEGHFCDLKSKAIQPSKMTRTLSAFANADGGEIFIGVDEVKNGQIVTFRKWNGFESEEHANAHIQILTELFPLGSFNCYTFLKNNESDGVILQIDVNKTNSITKAHDGIPYLRRGAQNIPVNNDEALRRLEFDKGVTTFERQTLNIPKETIIESDIANKFINDVIPSTTPETWLKKQLLLLNDLPTVAGTLLFHDEPQAALPKQSGIKIYRYATKDFEGKRDNLAFDPITIEGPVYNQIYSAIKKTIELVEQIKILGQTGLENIHYPTEALHEIITNAVLHRDYSLTKDVHIRIFDNRIEVESPGKLPGHISTENILNEQFARNGALVRIVNKFPNPPNKDVGEGLNTAFESFRKLRLKPPEIVETENSLIVKLRHEPLASPEEIVMNYIQNHKLITNSVGRDLTGIDSENEMKRVFQRLQAKDLIYLDPSVGGGASRWLLKEKEAKPVATKKNENGDQMKLF